MKRQGSAEWKGNLRDGNGTVSSASGVLKSTPYSFRSRFEDGRETNPEELIAAAHAACFSMAFSVQLGNAGLTPEWIRTQATADFDKTDAGFRLTKIGLRVAGDVPGIDADAFREAAEGAKVNCPVSKALEGNLEITLDAALA